MRQVVFVGVNGVALALALAGSAWAAPPGVQYTGAAEPGETTVRMAGYSVGLPPAETCWFEYGTTSAYGGRTDVPCAGTTYGNLTQLQPGTLYHYRFAGANADGTTYGVDKTFATSGTAPGPPPPGGGPPPAAAPAVKARVVGSHSPAAVARSGLRVRVIVTGSCPCKLRARLTVSGATARRLGITAKTLGTRTRSAQAGVVTLRVRLKNARARRALRRAASVSASLDVRITDANGRSGESARAVQFRRAAT
jgi:hypothetical protein